MHGYSARPLIPILCLLCLPAFSQETTVRVGVAMLRSSAKQISSTAARDRLVKALNGRALDKKTGSKVEAIALQSPTEAQAMAESKKKACSFVLYTQLTDLVTLPKYDSSSMGAGAELVPVFNASVEYRVVRVVDGAGWSGGFANAEHPESAQDAVWQALSSIATQAAVDLRSAPHGAADQPAQGVAQSAATDPGTQLIHQDFCSWLPTDLSHAAALHGVCEYAMSLPRTMPNFICDQETSRYWGDNHVPRDLITALVRYEDGNESYSGIKLNGQPAPSAITQSPGQWSSGEFGSNLRAVFHLHNHPVFEFSGENTLRGHPAWIFSYRIVKQNDPLWRLHGNGQVLAPPYGGELWVDQETGGLLRFRQVATGIPSSFPTRSAELMTEYGTVAFADGTSFLLPVEATVATRSREESTRRNVLRFQNCHKFRATAQVMLNVPTASGEGSGGSGEADASERTKEMQENDQIYAILREQALRDDETALEVEHRQELNVATVGALWKLAALEKARQRYLAKLEASTKSAPPPPTKAAAGDR